MTTTRDRLIAARELLTPNSSWIQDGFAHDENGEAVPPESPDAVCWCLSGALDLVAASGASSWIERLRIASALYERVNRAIPQEYANMEDWNDAPERTHQNVLDLLDRMIGEPNEEVL